MKLTNNNPMYFMSGGLLLKSNEDDSFDIRIYNKNNDSIIVNISLTEYLVWDAAKTGILKTDEFIFHAKKNLLPYNKDADDDALLNIIDETADTLVKRGLLGYYECFPNNEETVVMTQLAMSGLFLPMIKGNETLLMAKPTSKLKSLLRNNAIKANFLSPSRKEVLKWLDDGNTIFDYGLRSFKSKEDLPLANLIGKDVDYLINKGLLLCYGWYVAHVNK